MPGARLLIIGIDSTIGRALSDALQARGRHVIGTTRRRSSVGGDIFYLDLADAVDEWQAPNDVRCAILLASMTDQKQCEKNQNLAHLINVDNTLHIVRHLADRGVRVVFPSTNLVFDGQRPRQPADTPYRPMSLYAAYKAEAEQALLAISGDVAVCRLAKVLDARLDLMTRWLSAFADQHAVQAFRDLFIAPVSLRYAVEFLSRVAESNENGVFQISGDQELSYCELASALAKRLGRSGSLVECVDSAQSGIELAAAPRHPSLDGSRTERVFGLAPQTLNALLDDLTST